MVPEKVSGDDAEKEKAPPQLISLRELFKFASPTDYVFIFIGTISAMVHGSTFPAMTIFLGDIITAVVTYDGSEAGKILLESNVADGVIKMCIVGGCTMLFSYLQMSCWIISGENQAKRIRESFFKAIIRQDVGWFDKMSTGDLTNRLTADMNVIQEGMSDKFGLTIEMTSTFLSGFIIAYFRGWQLALVLTATLPVIAGISMFLGKLLADGSSEEQEAYAEAGSIAQQVISSIKTVVAFGGEDTEIKRYCVKLDDAERFGVKKAFVNGVGIGSIDFVIYCVYALAFWYGSTLVPDVMDAGQVLNVMFAIVIGAMSLGTAAPHLSSISAALGTAKTIFDIIERESPIDPLSEHGQKPGNVTGLIEFQHINFAYPTRENVQVLKDFSLTIQPGKSVALVGSSGSGKSTAVKLFERFYDPIDGSVLLDGVNLKSLNVKWLREQVGMVSQEPNLFDTTIRENILLGLDNFESLSVDEADKLIKNACIQANCWEFIQNLPFKLETKVGEAGTMLSGGQKQRIAIARALIKNPTILLLDEATSALDTESERIVQAALENASKNRTTITIAHRLSTIKNADLIVAMSKGEIVEQGTHEELIAKKGMYANLVQSQTLKGKEEEPVEKVEVQKVKSGSAKLGSDKELSLAEEEVNVDQIKIDYARLLAWNKQEYHWFAIGALGAMVTGATQPVFAIFFSEILTVMGTPQANIFALLFLAVGAISFLSNFAQSALFKYAGEKMTRRVREACFRSLLRQEMAFFDEEVNSTGNITTKLAEDASLVQGLTGQTMGAVFQGFAGVTTGVVIALVASWQMALVVLAMLPLLAFSGYLQMKALVGFGDKTRTAYETTSQKANETIQNIRTIAGITQESHFYAVFSNSILIPHNMTIRGAFISSLSYSFSQSVLHFSWAASLYYGAYLLKLNLYNPSQILTSMFAILFSAMAAGQVSNFLPNAAKAKLAASAIFDILDRKSKIDVNLGYGEQRQSSAGLVELNEVEFSYPSRPNTRILRGLELIAQPGKTVALVGASGCGKSTVMGLMLRWYESNHGSVDYDSLGVQKWNLTSLRSFMSIVGQEPVLFNISIRDNIAYGAVSAPDELQIHEAAKAANIHDFVMSLPNGYDENVGERGGQMSGGQKQRLAIARALIRNPKLLLLDEATSALDSESEVVVQEALDAAAKGRTTLVIAHRLSTIQNADSILVVDQGKIAESGTHSELLNLNGRYAQLVSQQSLR
jgi:ABC-type multidrug transport system fused ATPase/permease subunit